MSAAPQASAEKWRPLLEHSTCEVFEIMLKTKLEPSRPEIFIGVEFTAMVGMAGIVCGVLSVRCCHQSAMAVASAMLGVPPHQAGEHAWDALGEVANMIAGNFKSKIDGMAEKCMLSVPTVITGADYSFKSLSDSAPIDLWFRYNNKPLNVALEIHS